MPKAGDAQFQLVEALLSNRQVGSFAELSLAPRFARTWSSAYEALAHGQQQEEHLRRLFCAYLPSEGPVLCPLDTTVWPHPKARTLEGLVYEISPTRAARRHTAVVGHVYSLLGWVPEWGRSWGLGLANERLTLDTDALALGVKQVKELAALRQDRVLYGPPPAYSGNGRPRKHGLRFAFKEPST